MTLRAGIGDEGGDGEAAAAGLPGQALGLREQQTADAAAAPFAGDDEIRHRPVPAHVGVT